MKLPLQLRNNLILYTNYIDTLGNFPNVKEILKIILDESSTEEDITKAVIRLKPLVISKGEESAVAANLLGFCYLESIGVAEDEKLYFALFTFSANQGHAPGLLNLADCYCAGKGVAKDEKQAFELVVRASAQGYAHAQNWLGSFYKHGTGVKQDKKLAVEQFRLASSSGIAAAHLQLGLCYEFGEGVDKDIKRAVEFYVLSAAQGYAPAQCILGTCHLSGFGGVTKDVKEAVKYYLLAANEGNSNALYRLGYCYKFGIGFDKDHDRTFELYYAASKLGNTEAMNGLGFCYDEGLGVAKDIKRAVELYTLAANKGSKIGLSNLGVSYKEGRFGLEPDSARAVLLCQAAAEKGYAEANKWLTQMLSSGQNYPNLDKAVEFYKELQEKDPSAKSTLAFCYQMGLGVEQDIKAALELYRSLHPMFLRQWDIYMCYLIQYQQGSDLKSLSDFYEKIDSFRKKGSISANLFFAYLHEYGAPGLPRQSLYTAHRCYEVAWDAKALSNFKGDGEDDDVKKAFENCEIEFDIQIAVDDKFDGYVEDKFVHCLALYKLYETIRDEIQDRFLPVPGLTKLIAEYAYAEMPKTTKR